MKMFFDGASKVLGMVGCLSFVVFAFSANVEATQIFCGPTPGIGFCNQGLCGIVESCNATPFSKPDGTLYCCI